MTESKGLAPRYFSRSAFVCGLAFSALLVGCGQEIPPASAKTENPQNEDVEAAESGSDEKFILGLEASAETGDIRTKGETIFKVSTQQGSSLKASEKCVFPAGTLLPFSAVGQRSGGHVQVTLDRAPAGCSLTTGYFFESHVEISKHALYSVQAKSATVFKVKVQDSRSLPTWAQCAVPAGAKLYLTAAASDAGSGHVKATFRAGELANCGFTTGYLYSAHLERIDLGVAPDNDFGRVMEHILYWEGGCSDHPNDPGGRTFKGITAERGRLNGWTADVCTMPHTMILDIYRKDYWNKRAKLSTWPLNLAVMNTEVNSGGGKAQDFLDRMQRQNISGTVQEKGSWFVDQQTAYYRSISENNPKLRVFLTGWLNRSQDMQNVIWGRKSLSLDDVMFSPQVFSAKAYGQE